MSTNPHASSSDVPDREDIDPVADPGLPPQEEATTSFTPPTEVHGGDGGSVEAPADAEWTRPAPSVSLQHADELIPPAAGTDAAVPAPPEDAVAFTPPESPSTATDPLPVEAAPPVPPEDRFASSAPFPPPDPIIATPSAFTPPGTPEPSGPAAELAERPEVQVGLAFLGGAVLSFVLKRFGR